MLFLAATCSTLTPINTLGAFIGGDARNGRYDLRMPENSKAYFSCVDGKTLIGSESSTCVAGGSWNPPVPYCGKEVK